MGGFLPSPGLYGKVKLWCLSAPTYTSLQFEVEGGGYDEGGVQIDEAKPPKSSSLCFTELPDSLAGLIIQFLGFNL